MGSMAQAAVYPNLSMVGRTAGGVLVPIAVNSAGILLTVHN
jgi:hypothetical protein